MALPTTNLTFHADASADTDLWQTNTAGSFSNHPADGQAVEFWDDVEHTDIQTPAVASPLWKQSTPLMLNPCIDLNGTSQYFQFAANVGTAKTLDDIINNNAFTIFISIYAEGITTNAAAAYDNDAIMSEAGGNWGIHLKDSSSPKVLFYNWDTNEDTIPIAITLNASHVLMYRHQSGSIYGSIDNGTESSALSGNTTALTGQPRIGNSYGSTNHLYNGRVGEIAIYDAALTGTPFTDAMSYFMVKWITGAVAASEVEIHRTAVCTPVRIG